MISESIHKKKKKKAATTKGRHAFREVTEKEQGGSWRADSLRQICLGGKAKAKDLKSRNT